MPKYNGYVLPVQPERDKATYPHAIIQRIKYESGGFIAHFIYCTEPFYLDWTNKVVTYPDTATAYRCTYIYTDETFAWGEPITSENLNKSTDPDTVIWTDTDIYADNGMFFLGATIPAEVLKKWAGEKVFMRGYALGIGGAPAPFTFSPWRNIGGHKLPAFPYFDQSVYQYIVVQSTQDENGSSLIMLTAFSRPLSDAEHWDETSATPEYFSWMNRNPGRFFNAYWVEGSDVPKWDLQDYKGSVSNGELVTEDFEWEVMCDCLIWTSHDVYDPEGNLFMAAGKILPWKEAE